MKTAIRSCLIGVLVVALATPAHAGMLDPHVAAASDRERISALLAREDVRNELHRRGIDPEHAKARVAALTDAEARMVAAEIDTLPAGAMPADPISVTLMAALAVVGLVVLAGALVAKVVKSISKGE